MWLDHLPQAERYLRTAMRAIAAYGLAYGRYPHRTLTIVDPPDEAIGTGGMEYPTFITAGTLTPLSAWPLNRVYLPEISLELLLLGEDPRDREGRHEPLGEPALTEAIADWATGWMLDAMVGADRSFLEVAGLRLGFLDYQRLANHRGRGLEMIRQPSWSYDTGYTFNSYGRPSLTLRTLEGLLGLARWRG